jgi:hypothetical protein
MIDMPSMEREVIRHSCGSCWMAVSSTSVTSLWTSAALAPG